MNKLPSQNNLDYNETDNSLSEFDDILNLTIPNHFAGERLDSALAKLLPEYSRSRLTSWIKKGAITINGQPSISKHKLIGGEKIQIFCQQNDEDLAFSPEAIDLNIIFEDEDIIIINKPVGLVVHPAAGNWSGTLLNGLLHHCPELTNVPRAGIVHRLDKNTSGLMVIAKNLSSQNNLVKQLQSRQVKRIYRAIANGIVPFDGKIETLIGRDPHHRTKMAVVQFGGKAAITHIKVLEKYQYHSYIECSLETGRTHQIRVHMNKAKHPLVGDDVYGNPRLPGSESIKNAIRQLNRQALHAYRLSFIHPSSKEILNFEVPLPDDMYRLLSLLRLESGKDSALNPYTQLNNANSNHEEDLVDNEDNAEVEVFYVRD